MDDDILRRRISYARGELDIERVARDPFEQFRGWLDDALASDAVTESNAMSVSTVGANGRPSARIVLLRQWDARGFVFYTNYESRKGADLTVHPYAAILFWWGALERQVRIEGARAASQQLIGLGMQRGQRCGRAL